MRDRDIRRNLRLQLERQFAHDGPNTRILDELGICQGSARVDMAVINGVLHGYEIKSEYDTLDRLAAQQSAYSRVFDRMSIVACGAHLEKIKLSVPAWWEVNVAESRAGRVRFRCVRLGSDNPAVDAAALAQLLWRDEALQLLEDYGAAAGVRSKPRKAIWARLAEALTLGQLQSAVRATLKTRSCWRDPQAQH